MLMPKKVKFRKAHRGRRAGDLARINEEALLRMARDWKHLPVPSLPGDLHELPLSRDLDLFGPASVFQLLGTAHTPSGKTELAAWLLEPASPEEIVRRQEAVAELAPELDLRQQIEAVRQDRSLDEEMRARLIAGLSALLPSKNNRTVVQSLFDDPIYREKLKLLRWINDHLREGGRALVAAWSPGGKSLTIDEHIDFVDAELLIDRVERFDSGHVAVLAERRRVLAALTIDYETWQPLPPGKSIDWEATVFAPTERLLDLFDGSTVRLTFFVEMGEYFWLEQNRPGDAAAMKAQLLKAAAMGHDVQLHLHPSWLPELGAGEKDGEWHWDWSLAKAEDYPGDLVALIGRCKDALETLLKPARPDYRVTCFRAGAYQAQPFGRLSQALIANGIVADSSVYAGGVNAERGYDYSHAYSDSQPYFADLHDPQLRAVPVEEKIVELPIFTPQPEVRWLLDGEEAERLADRLIRFERDKRRRPAVRWTRLAAKLRGLGNVAYEMLKPQRRWVNRLLPRQWLYQLLAPRRQPRLHGCYVAIGHTKSDLRYDALAANVRRLQSEIGAEFVTLSEMAGIASSFLSSVQRTQQQELDYQVQRETPSVMGEARNWEQSRRLQEMIPLDVDRLLDFGCGAGHWSARIAEAFPWMQVTGIDGGEAFVGRARASYGAERVQFVCGDFTALPMEDGTFDCVYADNTIEHSFDVDGALGEIFRVLRPGGSLVAAFPLDGLNDGLPVPPVADLEGLRVERRFEQGTKVEPVTAFSTQPTEQEPLRGRTG